VNQPHSTNTDVIIIGGGAAGLMCAIETGKRSRNVIVLEKSKKVGQKILISGGGRCNFTNTGAGPHYYTSQNEHFCKSALARYTPEDFISLVKKHGIEFYEKKLGQLFCKDSARQVVGLLLDECTRAGVKVFCNADIRSVTKQDAFEVGTDSETISAHSVVIASGGLSIPKMGSTGFAYEVAKKFGLAVTGTRAGLVPFVFNPLYLKNFAELSGISIDAEVSCNGISFRENILITHRGISGPAILQISSYWHAGDSVTINLLPSQQLENLIANERLVNGKVELKTLIARHLPNRFVERVFELWLKNKPLAELSKDEISTASTFFHCWTFKPAGTEGYRTAEVTVGGIDTNEISSKTFESNKVPGLYFIGESLDVTGWLGGYNFQWAWASGWCAGQYA